MSKDVTDIVDVETTAITKGGNGEGRDPVTGRFVTGWKGGPGSPLAGRVREFREAALQATTKEDILEVWSALLKAAKEGEQWAVREFLDRTLGKELAALFVAQHGETTLIKVLMGVDQDQL